MTMPVATVHRAMKTALLISAVAFCHAWVPSPTVSIIKHSRSRSSLVATSTITRLQPRLPTTKLANLLSDFLSGGTLQKQSSLPYDPPLSPVDSTTLRTFAIQERAISFTGEDFDVSEITHGSTAFCRVRGAMLHLPGKDKMRIYDSQSNTQIAELDRKLVAVTPTYDIYNSQQQKIGWIERKIIALSDTFEVHLEGKGGFGFIKPPAAFYLAGDFLDRRFAMKNEKGQVVAKVTKEGWIQFDAFNHYQVQVAPGMDPALVIACACAIDEEFDEEHKERDEKQKARGR